MKNSAEETEEGDESKPVPRTQPLCRFFSQGRRCNYGERCKFLHVRDDSRSHEKNAVRTANPTAATPTNSLCPAGDADQKSAPVYKPLTVPAAGRRPCRYFISGHCTMEDRCRFWHPPQLPSVEDQPVSGSHTRAARIITPVSRPGLTQDVKLCDMTEEIAKQLRNTEISQLEKRFPKDQLIIQERSDGKVTFYRGTVEPTDPDWPFDLKQIDIMVSFPDNYPQETFTLDIPLDQDLPPVMARHVQRASLEWIQAKHATNQLMGKVELLFRPFLRWLDRSLERLFTEGARQLKKDIDLEKAGLQFIPYQELQATAGEKSEPASDVDVPGEDGDARYEGDIETPEGERPVETKEQLGDDVACEEKQPHEEASQLVENIKIRDPRRGTEVKLLGLRLGENTATVVAQHITVCLQCSRCKVTADLTLKGRIPCAAQCEKCNASINAAFRPCMLHHYSDVLGYLDLHNATAADLVLQECDLTVGCLSCSQDSPLQSVFYGQTKEFNCEHCHSKLSILAESSRFQFILPRTTKAGSNTVNYKTVRDPAVQKGKPLPEKGTCKHYKQSHRWLRFPCCGRAYPCDVCHDQNQDHPMELATRMICGFCAKEQPYGNGKPCVSCGSMMTRGARTSHWEGGLGCRSRVKMCRNDRQKYSNTNKTISRKAASEKK